MSYSPAAPTVGGSSGQVIFFDDFLGSSLGPGWLAQNRDGDQSNTELQWYLPANVTVGSSNLTIQCKVQTQGPRSYTSGQVIWPNFSFRFGTVEARVKCTGGLGPWPALWLLGSDCQVSCQTDAGNIGICNWSHPGSDEIDFMEILSSDLVHVWQNIKATAGDSNNQSALSDVSLNWHVFKAVWTASSVTWYIDGVQSATSSANVPQRSLFMLINVAVGGAGGAVTNGTLPQSMNVDWVRVTQG